MRFGPEIMERAEGVHERIDRDPFGDRYVADDVHGERIDIPEHCFTEGNICLFFARTRPP